MSKEQLQAQNIATASGQGVREASRKKENADKLEKYGGFDLLETSIEGVQNMNPERKARRKIFLNEAAKQGERDTLLKTLEIWASVLQSDNLTDMVAESEDKRKIAEETLTKNLATAIEETRILEEAYRTVALFYKNTEQDKVKNVTIVNAELEQLQDLDNTRFIDAIHQELVNNYDRLDLKNNYGILVVPGYLGNNVVIEKWAKIAHDNKVM